MLQALFINNRISLPLGIVSFDASFKYGVGADTKATNQANKEMNDANNQTQIDLWNQQKEYDYEMWQKNNEYNSPANQVKRYQEAGINPALAMSSITSGTSQSTAGGQTTPQTTPSVNQNPAQEVNTQVSNLALIGKQLSDIGKQNEEVRSMQIDNAWQNTERSIRLANSLKDGRLREEAIYNAYRANRLFDRTFEAQVQEIEERADLTYQMRLNASADGSLKELQKDAQTYSNNYLQPEQWRVMRTNIKTSLMDAITRQYSAKTDRINAINNGRMIDSNIKVNKATIQKIKAEMNNTIQDTETKKFWNSINDATKDSIILKTVSDANNASMQPFWNGIGALTGGFNVLSGFR